MAPLFCEVCGDRVNVVCPCKFTFNDGAEVKINVCLDCMQTGTLKIDLARKRLVAKILTKLGERK